MDDKERLKRLTKDWWELISESNRRQTSIGADPQYINEMRHECLKMTVCAMATMEALVTAIGELEDNQELFKKVLGHLEEPNEILLALETGLMHSAMVIQ